MLLKFEVKKHSYCEDGQSCHFHLVLRVAKKPGNLKFDNLGKKKKPGKPWNLRDFEKKTWNFKQKSLKNLEF